MTEAAKYKPKRSDSSNSPTGRGLYAQFLFSKRTTRPNGKACTPRYDLTFALPKTHADATQCANYKFLANHCMQAVSREPQWGGQWPNGGIWPIKDGDVPYASKPKPGVAPLSAAEIEEKYGWRKGHWIIEVTNYLEPGPRISIFRNNQIEELPAQTINGIEQFKSGDYCIVNLCAYTYWNEQYGCNFGFDGVLWVAEGKRVGGGSGPKSTAQMFGSVAPVASVMPAATPSLAQAPMHPAPSMPSPSASASPAAPAAGAPPAPPMPAPQQTAPVAPQSYISPQPAAPVAPTAAPTMAAPPVAPAAPVMAAPPTMPGAPGVLPAFPAPAQ